MKIRAFPDTEEFAIKESTISGILCKLVFPKTISIKWTEQNKIFRSSIWTNDGKLVSASYKKFTNLGEMPDFEPLNEREPLEYVSKVDGSTLCISKFNGTLIVRTRGTFDASTLENGDEILFLKQKYPLVFDNDLLNSETHSILCEWYSPKNVIIEREATEPTLWLTGIVKHEDYSYVKQSDLDIYGKSWKVFRPKIFSFIDINDMVSKVKHWQKGEGIVIYSNQGQILKKFKADRYIHLHKIASQLNNINGLLDLYVSRGLPPLKNFRDIIENEFDFEIAKSLEENIRSVCEAGESYKRFMDHIHDVIRDLRNLDSRKTIAEHIKKNFGKDSPFAFSALDGKSLSKEQIFNLIKRNLTDN